jgi:hypothetical protein
MVLSNYLGGESVTGGKLKEVGTSSWKSPNIEATNISLFSALPGGNKAKYCEGLGEYSIYCSSSLLKEQDDTLAVGRAIVGKLNYFAIDYNKKISGLSIRCLKD